MLGFGVNEQYLTKPEMEQFLRWLHVDVEKLQRSSVGNGPRPMGDYHHEVIGGTYKVLPKINCLQLVISVRFIAVKESEYGAEEIVTFPCTIPFTPQGLLAVNGVPKEFQED